MINISETSIPDITKNNIEQSKKNLADSIIKNIYPLFDEIYTDKKEKFNYINEEVKSEQKKLVSKKQELDELNKEVKRKRKINKLVSRIEKLITSGIAYETSLKHEMVVLLKTVDRMSDDRLNYNLNRTMEVISKRFANK